MTCRAQNLFAGLAKIFSGDEERRPFSDQRPSRDKLLTPSNSDPPPEFPPYTVIQKTNDYSIRLYTVYPVVEMEYQRREEGYAALGGYFDGENDLDALFSYTQPVVMTYYPDGRKVMQMYIGTRRDGGTPQRPAPAGANTGLKLPTASPTIASLPAPAQPGVRIGVAGGELVAVLRFEGYITPATAEAVRKRLMEVLKRDGVALGDEDAQGRFRVAQYGPVYQLGGRLNEMMLTVRV